MQTCSYKNCPRPADRRASNGLCNAHYHRLCRGTDMDKPIQNRGGGWLSTHGYRYLGKRGLHRQIVETTLGRRLGYNEVVHHLDGNPINNDVSNLVVMDRGEHIRLHCAGKTNDQRKADKAAHGLAGKP